jgi:hypothetical protein
MTVYRKEEVVIHEHVSLVYRGITFRLLYFMDRKSQLLQVDSRMKDAERGIGVMGLSGISEKSDMKSDGKSNIDLQQIELQVN